MNTAYRLIWDDLRHMLVIVDENSRARGKKAGKGVRRAVLPAAVFTAALAGALVAPWGGEAWAGICTVGGATAGPDGEDMGNKFALACGQGSLITDRNIQNDPNKQKNRAVAVGTFAEADYSNTAVGSGAHAYGYGGTDTDPQEGFSVAIGRFAQTNESGQAGVQGTVAIGGGNNPGTSTNKLKAAIAKGNSAIAIGGASRIGSSDIDGARAEGDAAIALGVGSSAQAQDAIAVGRSTRAYGAKNIAVGYQAWTYAETPGAIAIGSDQTGIGRYAEGGDQTKDAGNRSAGGYSIAIGNKAKNFTYGYDQQNQGYYANTKYAIAIGYQAHTHAANAFAIGVSTDATAERSFAIGTTATNNDEQHKGARAGGQGSIAFGDTAIVRGEKLPSSGQALAEDRATYTTANDAIAVGTNTLAQARNAVVVGGGMSYTYHDVSSDGKTMTNKTLYYNGSGWGGDAEGTGASVEVGADGGVAIGGAVGKLASETGPSYFPKGAPGTVSNYTAAAKAEEMGSIALGTGSLANRRASAAKDYYTNTGLATSGYDVTTGSAYAGAGNMDPTWRSNLAAFSVGKETLPTTTTGLTPIKDGSTIIGYKDANGNLVTNAVYTRQITGVAAGSADTDAVNVAQLKRVGEAAKISTDKRNVDITINKDGKQEITSPYIHVEGVEAYGNALAAYLASTEYTNLDDADKPAALETKIAELRNTYGFASATGTNAIAEGKQSKAEGVNSIAIGYKTATAAGASSAVALGEEASVTQRYGVAIGREAKALGQRAVATGMYATASQENAVALGYNATANYANAVALGSGSVTAAANPTASHTINGTTYNFAGTNPGSVVSVGSAGKERQITNLAAGRISEMSTDAINGSQLYAVAQAVAAASSEAGKHTVVKVNDWTAAPDGNKTFTTTGNLLIAKDATDDGDVFDIKLNDNITLGTGDDQINIDGTAGTITVGDPNNTDTMVHIDGTAGTITAGDKVSIDGNAGNATIGGVTIGTQTGGGANPNWGNYVTGLDNKNWDPGNITSGRAATEDQLKQVAGVASAHNTVIAGDNIAVTTGTNAAGGIEYTVATKKDVDFNSVTFNGGPKITNVGGNLSVGGVKITNVAPGDISNTSTDAINGSQLQGVIDEGLYVNANEGGQQKQALQKQLSVQGGHGAELPTDGQISGYSGRNLATKVTQSGGNNTIHIQMSENPSFGRGPNRVTIYGDSGSMTTTNGGQKTVVNPQGVTISGTGSYQPIVIQQGNVSMGGNRIRNVAPGVDDTDAVNVSQLKKQHINISDGRNTSGVYGGDTINFHGDRNIHVNVDGLDIHITLDPDLNVRSVTTGRSRMDNDGFHIQNGPSVTVNGIDAAGMRITNVADGIHPYDAVNRGQLDALDNRLSNRIDKAYGGIATVAASVGVPQTTVPGSNMLGAALGGFEGETALAVGYSVMSDNGHWILKNVLSASSEEFTWTTGLGYQW